MSFPFWSKGDEVGIWVVLAMFLGIDSAFLFVEGGSTTLFLVMQPFFLLLFGKWWLMRKPRIGKKLILDDNGVHLRSEYSYDVSISWDNLVGLYRSKSGLTILSTSGSEILLKYTIGGIKPKLLQEDIVNYLVVRSRWIDEKRTLQPKPPPQSVLMRRLAWSSVAGTAVFSVFGYYIRQINLGNVDILDLPFSWLWLLAACIFCGIAAFVAIMAWYKLKILQHPYLWDRSVPSPPFVPLTKRVQQDLQQHKRRTFDSKANIDARVELSTWLTRTWAVEIDGQQYEVIYDGRGVGYEEVRVDGSVVCRTPSKRWYVPRFEFLIGDEISIVEVRINALCRVRASKLTISGQEQYTEGRI